MPSIAELANVATPSGPKAEDRGGLTRHHGRREGPERVEESGLLAGFPLIDVKATLTDGKFHDVDSSVLAFEIAACAAFRKLRETGAPKLLEPMMKVEVLSPGGYLGDVIADLTSRRGAIQSTELCGDAPVVTAFVPFTNMFGYAADLASQIESRGTFEMSFNGYAPVELPTNGRKLFSPAAAMRA